MIPIRNKGAKSSQGQCYSVCVGMNEKRGEGRWWYGRKVALYSVLYTCCSLMIDVIIQKKKREQGALFHPLHQKIKLLILFINLKL